MVGGGASAPGTGSEAKLAVSAWRTAWSCCCSASVRRSSSASSCSRRSRALLMLCVCLCSTAFCSSKATFIFRRRRSSASRAVGGEPGQILALPCLPSAALCPSLCLTPGLPSLLCLQPHTAALWSTGAGEEGTHCLPPWRPLGPTLAPRTCGQRSPLFWSKNSSVKMGTSKVEKPSQSPPWDDRTRWQYFWERVGGQPHPLWDIP